MFIGDLEKAEICLAYARGCLLVAKSLKNNGCSPRPYIDEAKKAIDLYIELKIKWMNDFTGDIKLAA